MKTEIFNKKTARCISCGHFTGVSCTLHDHMRAIPVFADSFCGRHVNQAVTSVLNRMLKFRR